MARSTTLRPTALAAAFLSLLSFPALSSAQALHETDQVYFGAWVDTDVGYNDTPLKYNLRLGRNASVFHIAQQQPVPAYNWVTGAGGPAPEYMIENTSTDAAVFLTVYPNSLTTLTVDDHTALGNQVLAYQVDYRRRVFIRWAPEMQGTWNVYGQQPTEFVAQWQTMYRAVKSVAPDAAIVWAPNLGNGYPYGQTLATASAADQRVLDTNNNGRLDNDDDPYTPYYPGDDYVDWIGLSVYFKQNGVNTNTAQQPGFCGDVFTGVTQETGAVSQFNWYQMFCNKPGKACMVAESGAAYHPQINQGTATELEIQQAWWRDCVTNSTMFTAFPRVKLHMHFEYEKSEQDGGVTDLRDYRLTNETNLLNAFQADLAPVANNYLWATYRPNATPIQSAGPGVSAPATATSTSSVSLVLQTLRDPAVTAPPTLFGNLLASGVAKTGASLAALLGCGIGLGAWAVASRTVGL